jgi:hypothetical protein
MPISCERDDGRRLITITVTDPFRFEDILAQVDQQWAARIWAYAVLYDIRSTADVTPPSELQRIADHVRVVGHGQPRGAIGVVIPPRADMLHRGIQFSSASAPFKDIEILLSDAQVEAWIARHAFRR